MAYPDTSDDMLYKNGRTDRDVVWVMNSDGPKKTLLDGAQIPHAKGQL